MPGNNFPPLCEFAFIRLQRGHLERLWQEKKKKKKVGGHARVKEMNTEGEKKLKKETRVRRKNLPRNVEMQACSKTGFSILAAYCCF